MLIYFWKNIMGKITMKSEASRKQKEADITDCIDDIRNYLTLVNAFSGCDTTSAVYGQGKLAILKLLERFKAAMEGTDVFLQKARAPERTCEAGIRIFIMLYCGKDLDSLADLRYLKQMNIASS